jgi:hypothetical protein
VQAMCRIEPALSSWNPHNAALVRVLTAPEGLDARGGTVSQSSPVVVLATGRLNRSADARSIELIEPDTNTTVVRIVWPDAPTISTPAGYSDVASTTHAVAR